jgi:TonB family protein
MIDEVDDMTPAELAVVDADAKRIADEAAAAAAQTEEAKAAEAARVAREERLAAERARQEQLAAERAAKAQKKAELSHELAAMSDPDEVIADAAEARPLAPVRGSSRAKNSGPARASGVQIGGRPTSSRAGAAAALAETSSESLEPGDTPGDGGSDLIMAPSHGTEMPDGNGVSYLLDGPVGNRQLLKRAVPSSPDWVGTRGLDLTVTVRFQVTADGRVKPGAVIQKTSGFPEIDQRALKALRQWRFKPVAAGGSEVWGRVTFRFTS